MSEARAEPSATSFNSFLLVPILLFFGLLIVAVLRSPNFMTSSGVGSAEIVVAPLILSTYALMATALAGRATVDLSIGPLIGFINVTLIQFAGADLITSPIAVFAYALATGVVYQLIFGLIVIFVRVQPIIVSLSGFLALSGINLVILPRPGGIAPEWMSSWGAGTSILSPVLFMVAIATAGWLLLSTTAFFGHLRLVGSDERAAYTSGVRIGIVRLGAHVIAGLFAGLASLAFTALINSGDPTQGTTYTLISVTALVLGGTSLAGGRATVIGSLLGALNLFLIGYVLATFNFGQVQGFVTDLSYGAILVLSLLLTVLLPRLQRWLRYVSPLLVFVVLGLAVHGRRTARDLRLRRSGASVRRRDACRRRLGAILADGCDGIDRRRRRHGAGLCVRTVRRQRDLRALALRNRCGAGGDPPHRRRHRSALAGVAGRQARDDPTDLRGAGRLAHRRGVAADRHERVRLESRKLKS